MTPISIFIPMKVKSLNETRGRPWRGVYQEEKRLKTRIAAYLRAARVQRCNGPKCKIFMTRFYGSRGKPMDNDNLRGGLKPVRDAVAMELGIDDNNAWQWPEPVQKRADTFEQTPDGVLIRIEE